MSTLALSLLLQVATAPATAHAGIKAEAAKEHKICRDMLTSSSRVRPVRVCKTKAAWQRWQRCHSATRYCAPPRQATVTMASLPNEKLICKYLKETGSRLGQQRICATKREWDLAEKEAQETLRNRQSYGTLTGGSEEPRPEPGGGGPR